MNVSLEFLRPGSLNYGTIDILGCSVIVECLAAALTCIHQMPVVSCPLPPIKTTPNFYDPPKISPDTAIFSLEDKFTLVENHSLGHPWKAITALQ